MATRKRWIGKMRLKKGALRSSLGIKGKRKIPIARLRAAAKRKGKLGRRARLALTFRKMRRR